MPESTDSAGHLDPRVDDPDGTITCTCGEVFTGANFADRMSQWREHTEAAHA